MSDQNTIDSAEARRVVGEIEGMLAELLSMRGTYMAECKQVRERIKGAKEDAVEAGIPRKALNLELKRRDFERRIDALIHDADEDDAALAEQIRAALGDFASLPLGMAALGESGGEPEKPAKRTGKARGAAPADKSAALDEIAADDGDVRPAFLRDRDLVAEAKAELDARVAENAARLEGGIRKLDA